MGKMKPNALRPRLFLDLLKAVLDGFNEHGCQSNWKNFPPHPSWIVAAIVKKFECEALNESSTNQNSWSEIDDRENVDSQLTLSVSVSCAKS
jgi:hypothetical protein